MLKISTVDGRGNRCVIVEGKLIEPWAGELRTACEKARDDLGVRELIVDLQNLTIISNEGEEVLLQLLRQGVRIVAHGLFTRQILQQLTCRVDSAVLGKRSESA